MNGITAMRPSKATFDSINSVMKAGTPGQGFYMPGMDAALASGMAFVIGELEKRDPRLLEPLTSVTWMRDIVAKPGGGWVEYTSNYFVDYATTGNGADGIIGAETSNIPVMQANTSKDIFKVFTWSNILKISVFDQLKQQEIGRSLDQILDNGIRLNYNKTLDRIVYYGLPSFGTYGLVNNPNVVASSVPNGASGYSAWNKKTPDEILADINNIMVLTWAASEYDLTGMANHILIPPAQYAYITSQKVSSAGNISILQFLLENNIGRNQGIDLKIVPCRQCIGAGTGGTDRMVGYVNDEDRVNIDLTVPLSRIFTAPNVQGMAYETAYAAQIGQVKFLYTQCVHYSDGI